MSSFEALEFDYLIGDQLITVGRDYAELESQGLINISIDGHPVKISRVMRPRTDASGRAIAVSRTTIYDAAHELYVKTLGRKNPIPTLCHREHMTPAAVCRVCVVEIKGAPRLAPACQRVIEPGMEISTILTSQRVRATVKTLVELLLSDYRAARGGNVQIGETGENELESLARSLGLEHSRFPAGAASCARDDSSMLISVDRNACILCDRCIRGCNEIRHNEVLGRMGKGYTAQIAFDLNNPMGESSCVTCGECMVSCPTGALTNRAVVADTLAGPEYEEVGPEELAAHPLFSGISRAFPELEPQRREAAAIPAGRNRLPRGRARLDRLHHRARPFRGPPQESLAAARKNEGERLRLLPRLHAGAGQGPENARRRPLHSGRCAGRVGVWRPGGRAHAREHLVRRDDLHEQLSAFGHGDGPGRRLHGAGDHAQRALHAAAQRAFARHARGRLSPPYAGDAPPQRRSSPQ